MRSVTIPDWFYDHSDGASVPGLLRRFIIRWYGEATMADIDDAGYYHDWLMYKHPGWRKRNRKMFTRQLIRNGVPRHLVCVLALGLSIYDLSPGWLQSMFKKTV